MDVIMDGWYGAQAAPVRYHMYWPSAADPAWLYNTTEQQARRVFYGVNYVPTFRFDGQWLNDPSDFGTSQQWYNYARTTVNNRAQVPSELIVDLTASQDAESIYVSVDLEVDLAIASSMKLYVNIMESWLRFAPQGKFYYVFRDMVPNTNGADVTIHNVGETQHFEFAVAYDDSAYHADRMIVQAFVQVTGTKAVVNAAMMNIPTSTTDVAANDVPLRLALDQNMPNPFNPTTTIGFALDRSGEVKLTVFSPAGRLVSDLVNGDLNAGDHWVVWDGRDGQGRDVGSGVYYYRLETEKTNLTKKMILIR
ncbi:MAG: FlgD immunoglobulin-like domain containing protein [Candidatus Eisenbacteria bacterium]